MNKSEKAALESRFSVLRQKLSIFPVVYFFVVYKILIWSKIRSRTYPPLLLTRALNEIFPPQSDRKEEEEEEGTKTDHCGQGRCFRTNQTDKFLFQSSNPRSQLFRPCFPFDWSFSSQPGQHQPTPIRDICVTGHQIYKYWSNPGRHRSLFSAPVLTFDLGCWMKHSRFLDKFCFPLLKDS